MSRFLPQTFVHKKNSVLRFCSENLFEIWGLAKQVTEAHKFTQSRLLKYNQAATLSDYVSWKYEDPPKSGKWKPFALLNNYELEAKFKVSKNQLSNSYASLQKLLPDFRSSKLLTGTRSPTCTDCRLLKKFLHFCAYTSQFRSLFHSNARQLIMILFDFYAKMNNRENIELLFAIKRLS